MSVSIRPTCVHSDGSEHPAITKDGGRTWSMCDWVSVTATQTRFELDTQRAQMRTLCACPKIDVTPRPDADREFVRGVTDPECMIHGTEGSDADHYA
jgi:hypothetical protein